MSFRYFVLKDLNRTKIRERSGMTTHLDRLIRFFDRKYYFYDEEVGWWERENGMDQNPDGFVWEWEYKEITEEEVREYTDVLLARKLLIEGDDE